MPLVTDKTLVENAEEIRDGDELRNINSYEYLLKIVEAYKKEIPDPLPSSFRMPNLHPFTYLADFFTEHREYDPQYPYGNLYTFFLSELESNIDNITKERDAAKESIKQNTAKLEVVSEQIAKNDMPNHLLKISKLGKATYENNIINAEKVLTIIDSALDSIYVNPNQALERAARMIEGIVQETHQTSSVIESSVRQRMKGKGTSGLSKLKDDLNYVFSNRNINNTTPQYEGSDVGRLSAMMSSTFKPQLTTSMSSVRNYEYKLDENGNNRSEFPLEYRFGTQGQYHHKAARVSPMFEAWLKVQAHKRDRNPREGESTRITHVYFNNLGLDRTDMEGMREKRLTEQLHQLENRHQNIAVITLPADKGLLDKHMLEDHHRNIPRFDAFQRMLAIANGSSTDRVKDFLISNDVKQLLYGKSGDGYDIDNEATILMELLNASFEKMGLSNREFITPAEQQAVYFHFMKYELTNFIIDRLKPDSFNMSCKDAIDRGGVSSAYYNVMKSLDVGRPLNKEEFHRALHAAPTLVKGRGMNHHAKLIWNAVNAYLNGSAQNKEQAPAWLVEWRDMHAPAHTKEHGLKKIEAYIAKRQGHDQRYYTMFGTHDRQTKLNAASKLLSLITHPEQDIYFTRNQQLALQQGNLGTVYADLIKTGVITESQIKLKGVDRDHEVRDRPRRHTM